jgi:hypothetical protein
VPEENRATIHLYKEDNCGEERREENQQKAAENKIHTPLGEFAALGTRGVLEGRRIAREL